MGIKKLLFMYVEKTRGFRKQNFNFSTMEHFHVDSSGGGFDLVLDKADDRKGLPCGFWQPNISEISLLIGENGSGKTTIMQILCQWIDQLSRGRYPQEEGVLVFQDDDRYGCAGFSSGYKKEVFCDHPMMKVYSKSDLEIFFSDVKLVYFSNTMTDLNVENSEILTNYSLPQRLKEVWKEGGFINEDIIAGYKMRELKKRYDGKKKYSKQTQNVLDRKSPLTYIQLEVNHLTFDELDHILPKKYQLIGKVISDLWSCYFPSFEKLENKAGDTNKRSQNGDKEQIEKFVVELLQAAFIGIIMKLVKCEEQYTVTEEPGIAASILEQLAVTDYCMAENSVAVGGEWIRAFIKDLLYQCREGYSADKYKPIFGKIWAEDFEKDIDAFLVTVLSYLEQGVFWNEKMELLIDDEKKSIRQIRVDEQNGNEFEKFMEIYGKIFVFMESICLEWNASSGESNWANLYALLPELSEERNYIWFLLDEPDNTFHLEWKRQLMKEFIDICGKQDKVIQAWISTHSPIMLSDVPGISVIYLKSEVDKQNKLLEKKVCTESFTETFAQNIYVLFNHAFFMEKGVIGAFANSKIVGVLRTLEQIECNLKAHPNIGKEEEEKIRNCEETIGLVSEPMFKKYMQQCLLKCKKMAGLE